MREELDIPMPRMVPAEPGYRVRSSHAAGDPGTMRLALIGGGITLVLLLIGGAWKLTGHGAAALPVVHADSRPLRSKPDNAGGMQVEGQNDAILSGALDGKDSLAPPPETPAPQALKDEATQLLAARQAAAAAPPPQQPVPAPVAASPPVAAAASPSPSPSPVQRASVAAPPAMEPPQAPAAAMQQHATAAAVPSALGGHAAVQLAALGSEEQAMTEWRRLSHKMPDLLGTRQPSVQKIEAHGKTFWRLRTGGFVDIAQATAFCQQVRAQGGGCTLARF